MRRLPLSFAVLALISVSIIPQHSVAAPLPAPYAAVAGGDVVAVDLDVTNGLDLAAARLAVSESKMNGGTSPSATATASNLGAALTGLNIAVQSNTQTAPPDHPNPDSGPLVGAGAPNLFNLAPLTTLVHARTQAAIACTPSGGVMGNSFVQTAGANVSPAGVGTVVDIGISSTSGLVNILPEPQGDPLNRGILSSAAGTIGNITFLNGQVGLAIAGQSDLQAFASGVPGGANTTYSPGTVTVTVGSTTTPVALGSSATFNVPNGRVVITVNQPIITEAPNGLTAAASVAVVTADVRVGPVVSPLATAKVDLLPLRVSAVAPPGGIDCRPPAPMLNTPALGSTITDTTPTFTGTAQPGAEVEIFIDGGPIGTTTATGSGNFSYTPTTPLGSGFHNYTATQTTDGGTSPQSNGNGFAILGPPVLESPADGSATNDTTPTFTGLTFPGAQVDIFVDGNPIGTTTANSSGRFTFTPGSPLAPGNRQARANAQVNGVTSGLSDVNDFAIDVTAPAAPTLNKPADGEVTNDRTPTFTGRAEPGAEVGVFVDGASIDTTTAIGNGDFSFTPTTPLAAGPHEWFVGATDAAGNDSPRSNTNGFRIDNEDPAAPGITSPAEGGSTSDSSPTITGTAEPGSEVIILIDGDRVGSTTADANGNFSFTVPDALSPGEYEVSAIAVDESGNRSAASDPVSFGVLGTGAEGDDGDDDDQDEDQNNGQNSGQNNGLAQTGGAQLWLPIAGGLGLLAGATILTATRWRRRRSQP